MSTVWRYSLRFEAAAVETHHRTASPLPGAHVVADIRGAAPGWNSALSLLSVVCVETSKAQGEEEEEKKLYSETHRPLQVIPLCPLHSGFMHLWKKKNIFAPECSLFLLLFLRLVQSAVSGYQLTVFGRFSPHLLGFFRSSCRVSVITYSPQSVHFQKSCSRNWIMDTHR